MADHQRAIAQRNVDAILDAAEDLLARRAHTTMSAVAKQAGVSRVTLRSGEGAARGLGARRRAQC